MTQSATALIVSGLFAVFLSLSLTTFYAAQIAQSGAASNMTGTLNPSIVNDSRLVAAQNYQAFESSASDQTSQITLFKNAPSTIKQQVGLSAEVFGNVVSASQGQMVAGWVIAILVTIFLIYLGAILMRIATGQTP